MSVDFENRIDDSLVFNNQIDDFIKINSSSIMAVKVPMPIELQDKEVEPTTVNQMITADKGYSGLGVVTVKKIPEEYIVPSGEIVLTENKIYNIRQYASANVQVGIDVSKTNIDIYKYQDFTRTLNSGGTISTDDEYVRAEEYLQGLYALIGV